MILDNIDFNSIEDYIYMERYVNYGSPSGFTEKYTTSLPTSAKGINKNFHLCRLYFPDNITIQDFGLKPPFIDDRSILIHPDMIYNPSNNSMFSVCTKIVIDDLIVAPTASSRTVKLINENGWFIKLNYKGLIGRIDRNVGKNQALSAIEVSDIIVKAIDKNKMPKKFYFMKETFARVIKLQDEEKPYELGMVLREPNPYPNNKKIKYLIPAFSLFSKDDNNPNDETLLTQLIKKQNKTVEDYLFEDIISPIFESYFSLLTNCGLQLECHAQNTLFAIDNNFNIVGVVAKDAESIDKDLSLMEKLNIVNDFKTTNYKCLREDDYNYFIMHSFMFDFKLGEYLITPIIEDAFSSFQFDKSKLIQKIKNFNQKFISNLPIDFFPNDNKWYSYENKVWDRTQKRPYIGTENPKYR